MKPVRGTAFHLSVHLKAICPTAHLRLQEPVSPWRYFKCFCHRSEVVVSSVCEVGALVCVSWPFHQQREPHGLVVKENVTVIVQINWCYRIVWFNTWSRRKHKEKLNINVNYDPINWIGVVHKDAWLWSLFQLDAVWVSPVTPPNRVDVQIYTHYSDSCAFPCRRNTLCFTHWETGWSSITFTQSKSLI